MPTPPLAYLDDEKQNTSVYLSDETSTEPTEVDKYEALLATGVESEDLAEIKASQTAGNADFVQGIIDNAFLSGEQRAEVIQHQVDEHRRKMEDFYDNPDYFYEQIKKASDPSVEWIDLRYGTNILIARRALDDAFDSEGEGVIDSVVDFGSMVFRESFTPTGITENLTKEQERWGREIMFSALTMKPSEFKEYFKSEVEMAMSRGIDGNSWALSDLQGALYNAGFDSMAGFEQIFGVLDLVGLGSMAKPLVKGTFSLSKGIVGAVSRGGRMAAADGLEESAEAIASNIGRVLDQEGLNDIGPGSLSHANNSVNPSSGRAAKIMAENRVAQEIDETIKSGAAGTSFNRKAVADKLASDYVERVGWPVMSSTIDLVMGSYHSIIRLGKNSGAAFKPMADGSAPLGVRQLAEETGGVVKEAVPGDPSKGYVVELSKPLAEEDFITGFNWKEIDETSKGWLRGSLGRVMNNPLFASTATRDINELTTLAQMAEGSLSRIGDIIRKAAKPITKLGQTERANLNAVVGRLRDSPEYAKNREWYTPEQFENHYRGLHGEAPSAQVMDAYNAVVELSDAAYVMRANNIYRRYLKAGFNAIETNEGVFRVARKTNFKDVPPKTQVFDPEHPSTFVWFDNYKDVEGFTVWKLDEPMAPGVEYVVRPKAVRELSPEDVMGYNAGTSRINPTMNYFVTLAGDRMKTLLGSFTHKEALTAQAEIKNIRAALLDGSLTDDIVRANNTWNPQIESVTELNDFMVRNKWKLEDEAGEIGVKPRDAKMIDSEVSDGDVWRGTSAYEYSLNQMVRNDTVLPEFGGRLAYNVDPISSLSNQLASTAHALSFNAYTQKSMVSWVKTALKSEQGRSWFNKDIPKGDYRRMFMEANISGTDPFSLRMRELHSITRRRLGVKGEVGQFLEGSRMALAEFIWDKGLTKTAKTISESNPEGALLRTGFYTAFGFLSLSQAFVQTAHVPVMIAISPRHGAKAVGMAMGMRSLPHLFGSEYKLALKRASKFFGIPEKELDEMVTYMRTSGRDLVDGDAMELGTGVDVGIGGGFSGESFKPSKSQKALASMKQVGKTTLDASTAPFRWGERTSRITGVYTAILEWKAKNPGASILTDRARMEISRREQDISLNMTNAARPLAQDGLMKVPTQWLSYPLRAMEGIFVGRNLSAGERARMAFVLGPMYGGAGLGFPSAGAYIADQLGIAEDSAVYTGFKWSVIDGIMDALLPDIEGKEGLVLGPRLTPMPILAELYTKYTSETTLEFLLGPSGQISGLTGTGGYLGATLVLLDNLINKRTANLTEDTLRILRQPTGIDNISKAIGIFNNGTYQMKDSMLEVPFTLSVREGIGQLLGVSSIKAAEWYDARTSIYRDSKHLKEDRKEVNRRAEVAFQLLRSNDPADKERGLRMLNELNVLIKFSGHSPANMVSLQRSILSSPDQINEVMQSLLQYDRMTQLSRLQTTLGN